MGTNPEVYTVSEESYTGETALPHKFITNLQHPNLTC
jgi:hypothetical protein